MIRLSVCSFLLASIALASLARGQNPSVTLQASLDNAIFSNSGTLSSGQGDLFTGRTVSHGVRRALVAFDIAKHVPAGAKIISVELQMSVTKASRGPSFGTFVHRVTANWGEGTSQATSGRGSPATTGDATWTYAVFNTQQWKTPGGDFISPASTAASVGSIGRYKFTSTAAFVADAQLMLDTPASNFGWLLETTENITSARRWASRENASSSLRPTLTIVYQTTAASVVPTGKGCNANGRSLDHTATGLPKLGNASFALNAVNGPSGGIAVLIVGVGLQNPPIPLNTNQCFLYLSVAGLGSSFGSGFDNAGTVTYPVPIPSVSSLVGIGFETQVFSIGPSTTLRSSNALSIRIGT